MTTPTFRLSVRKGPNAGQVLVLTKPEIRIGREMTNDLAINDAEVSRRHAILRFEAGSYVIEDLGSTNGILINSQRLLGPHTLKAGEIITLGEQVELVYEAVLSELADTVVSPVAEMPPAPPVVPAQPRQPVPRQPAKVALPVAPVDIEQDNLPTEEVVPETDTGPSSRELWLMAGFGCLVLIAIACAAVVLAIEYFNLWCTLFGSLIPGC
mgnify:CR=1 FL=1